MPKNIETIGFVRSLSSTDGDTVKYENNFLGGCKKKNARNKFVWDKSLYVKNEDIWGLRVLGTTNTNLYGHLHSSTAYSADFLLECGYWKFNINMHSFFFSGEKKNHTREKKMKCPWKKK